MDDSRHSSKSDASRGFSRGSKGSSPLWGPMFADATRANFVRLLLVWSLAYVKLIFYIVELAGMAQKDSSSRSCGSRMPCSMVVKSSARRRHDHWELDHYCCDWYSWFTSWLEFFYFWFHLRWSELQSDLTVEWIIVRCCSDGCASELRV